MIEHAMRDIATSGSDERWLCTHHQSILPSKIDGGNELLAK